MTSNVRPESMQRITNFELANAFIDEQVAAVRAQVGDKKVLLALSGGVVFMTFVFGKRATKSLVRALLLLKQKLRILKSFLIRWTSKSALSF